MNEAEENKINAEATQILIEALIKYEAHQQQLQFNQDKHNAEMEAQKIKNAVDKKLAFWQALAGLLMMILSGLAVYFK